MSQSSPPALPAEMTEKDDMSLLSPSIWDEVDLSESYLVCCMFEEAASLASSILRRVCSTLFADTIDDTQLDEIMVSASMVLVQSMKELGRTKELFVELRTFFGSMAAIPVQVLLTGACMQISEGYTSNLGAIFEEFLSKWKFKDDEKYVSTEVELQSSSDKRRVKQLVMDSEKYFEVVEAYTITLVGTVFCNLHLAISWTEKAELPEEYRQVLLRRLHSMLSAKLTAKRSESGSAQTPQQAQNMSSSAAGFNPSGHGTHPRIIKQELHHNKDISSAGSLNTAHPSTRSIMDRMKCCIWWIHTVRLKVGNNQLVVSFGKQALLGSMVVLIYYIMRQRRDTLKRLVSRQISVIKRALIDAWQLAFSVQLNPLAAIQQLPSAPHGSLQ